MLLAEYLWSAYNDEFVENLFLMNQPSLPDAYFKPKSNASDGCIALLERPKTVQVDNVAMTDPAPAGNEVDEVQPQAIEKNATVIKANAFDVLGNRTKRRKLSPELESTPPPKDQLKTQTKGKRTPKVNGSIETELLEGIGSPKRTKGKITKPAAPLSTCAAIVVDGELPEQTGAHDVPTQSTILKTQAMESTRSPKATKAKLDLPASQELRKSPRSLQNRTKVTMKNGKFVHELKAVMKYDGSTDTGLRIQTILASPRAVPLPSPPASTPVPTKKLPVGKGKSTHPFFSGKPKGSAVQSNSINEAPSHPDPNTKKPVAWSDLVFKSKQTTAQVRDLQAQRIPAPWPVESTQHTHPNSQVRPIVTRASVERKQKSKAPIVSPDEDVLIRFSSKLPKTRQHPSIRKPTKLYMPAHSAVQQVDQQFDRAQGHPALHRVRAEAFEDGWFDRGNVPGPLPWAQKYGPTCWQEVLQPESFKLFEWLKSLAVHNVKQGLSSMTKSKKRKTKKKAAELDDFIVSDEEPEMQKIKNAILIVGPHGCGKTAAVYAVAQQLQFEVFEMHPGMRRSQRDIVEKVGDMTQNHMVQQGPTRSREASLSLDFEDAPNQETKQGSLGNFFGAKPAAKSTVSTPMPPQRKAKEQKQSVVLFEEVDQVFEDDRGFWSGVQTLIEASKRPVILTCNRLDDVPLQELDLYAILDFTAIPADVAEAYMTYIALAEGHIIDKSSVRTLYEKKNYDLRASITELDFWCQMTLGSDKSGLDWFPEHTRSSQVDSESNRTFSKGSYHHELDMLSSHTAAPEAWYRYADTDQSHETESLEAGMMAQLERLSLEQCFDLSDQCSLADLLDCSFRSEFLSSAETLCAPSNVDSVPGRPQLCPSHISVDKSHFFNCLEPLNIERPVFPPAQGRLAPTIDAASSILAADVAPYVRSIAAFDRRLEGIREQLFSSQGKKTRNTRAARAAAEGGDKASTRRERWFHASLDLDAVLRTGGDWPQYINEGEDSAATSMSVEQDLVDAVQPTSVMSPLEDHASVDI